MGLGIKLLEGAGFASLVIGFASVMSRRAIVIATFGQPSLAKCFSRQGVL
jgi:hypothetical protein